MSLKTLFIANAVMVLFVGFVLVQGLIGLDRSGLAERMYEQGMMQTAP